MKLHLTRDLRAAVMAVLAIGTFTLAADPERPYFIQIEGGDITEDIRSYQGLLSDEDDVANKAQSYVKDSSNTAAITGSFNMDTRLIVREGTLSVSNATITQQCNGIGDFLIVGGNKVDNVSTTLILDKAQIIQTDAGYSGYNKSITVGNKDGEGSLIMRNNSVVKSGQLFHGGYYSYNDVAKGSYKNTTGNETYFANDTPKAGHLQIESGSKLYAGTGYMICDMDITIDGVGSEFIGCSRSMIDSGAGSASWLGDNDGCTSKIDVKAGGAMKTYNRLHMSDSNAETHITVSGNKKENKNSLFAAYNRVSLATQSKQGTVSITANDNATVHLADATMGAAGASNKVTIDIDGTSSYTGMALTLNEGAEFKNNGRVELTSGTIITKWRDDRHIGLEASLPDYENARNPWDVQSVDVASTLTMNGGKFTNNGTLSVDTINLNGGDLILGEGATLELMLDDTAALIFGDGSLELAANTTLVNVKLIVNSISTFSMRSETVDFILASGNTQSVDDFYEMLESEEVQVTFEDAAGTELSGYSIDRNEQGQLVVTESVPEPTTATLSLLALAGLAARRRRK